MNESMEWIAGDAVASGFPVTGFSNLQYAAMYHEYLMTAGGRTADNQVVKTTWATMDGISWALMASGDANFTKREGAMITNYDDKFFLIGGIERYVSIDRLWYFLVVDRLDGGVTDRLCGERLFLNYCG